MYNFDYVKPASVADAVSALSAEDAAPISGGQTLIPTLKARLNQPSALVDLSGLEDLKGISVEGGVVKIGGGVTHGEIADNADVKAKIPGLAYQASRIGCPAVRHRGTIGGSVANNDPSACYPSACMALGATIHTTGGDIAADDFFQGMFDTALGEGQIVTGVSFPIPEGSAYEKFAQPASRFPLVGVFAAKFADGVKIGVTGASEGGVFRWSDAESALSGGGEVPAAPAADGMISDIHGSAEYRAHLVAVMTKRAVAAM